MAPLPLPGLVATTVARAPKPPDLLPHLLLGLPPLGLALLYLPELGRRGGETDEVDGAIDIVFFVSDTGAVIGVEGEGREELRGRRQARGGQRAMCSPIA